MHRADHSTRALSRRRVLAAAGSAGIGGLAGCFARGSESEDITVDGELGDEEVTLQWAASQEEAGEADAIMQALYDAGLPENVSIDFVAGSGVASDRQDQYQRWLSAGREHPDLLRMDNGWTRPFIARDQLLNLSDNLPEERLNRLENDYFDMVVETARGDQGDVYGIPLWAGLPTMLYRRDLVEQAGYAPQGQNWATESMHWREFSRMVADVREQNGLDYGFTFQADNYSGLACCTFNEFMTSWGGAYFGGPDNLFGPIGERPITVNEQPVRQSIRMVQHFIHGNREGFEEYAGGIAPVAVLQWTEQSSARPFGNGNAVAHRNWPYFVGQFGADGEFGEDLGVMPIPYGVTAQEAGYERTGGPTAALGGQHLSVNPNSNHLPAAMEVVKTVMSDQFNLDIFGILGQIPPKHALLETEQARNVPVMGRYVDTFRVAGENVMPRPVTVVWPDESTAIAEQGNAAYGLGKTAREAMSDLEPTIEAIEHSI